MPIGMQLDNGLVNRTNKLIINPWTGPTECGWSDCWDRAREGYDVRMHEHPRWIPCSWVDQAGGVYGRHAHYNFCSERCARYWVLSSGLYAHETAARNNGLVYGMAGPGDKLGRYR